MNFQAFVLPRALFTLLFAMSMACAGPSTQRPGPGSFGHEAPSAATVPIAAATDGHDDPVVTDGDKYKSILDNAHVRVLRYSDKPGDKTHPHYHREFVLYALSDFRRRLIFPDGTVKERDFVAGEAIWMPAQIHSGENIGRTDTHVIIVEVKTAGSAAP